MKVIAFDVFGTVFDFSGVPHSEVKEYAEAIRKPKWEPLYLPESWEHLPLHPDSREGIQRLRTKFFVVTCSNGPLGLLSKLSKNADLQWDAIIPLELSKSYKPSWTAYMTVCRVLGVKPEDVTMVTANKTFGDIEASGKLDMTPQLIRHEGCPKTIIELAESLGC